MPRLEIRNHRTGTIIYEGEFATARACVEQAVGDGICLDYADLRHTNLANATLDDAVMRHVRLDGANLTGANLSEAQLDGTSFVNAALYAACLCLSSFSGCGFEGATFGGTDIAGSRLQACRFSTLSAFSLNFIDAAAIADCRYYASEGAVCPFSKPPLVLQGLALPVIALDHHLKIGSSARTWQEWDGPINDNAPQGRPGSSHAYTFFQRYQPLLRDMYKGHGESAANNLTVAL